MSAWRHYGGAGDTCQALRQNSPRVGCGGVPYLAVDLSVFEAKALAHALTEHGHSVSERTVQRWKAGTTKPKPQDIRAIRELLAATEKEPPWLGRLQTKVDSILSNQGRLALLIRQPPVTVKPDERLAVQYLRELLAGIPQQPVEDSPEGDGSPDRGAPDRAAQ